MILYVRLWSGIDLLKTIIDINSNLQKTDFRIAHNQYGV
jgi:hypothetical protein